jgi:hypothetical protein
MNRLVKLFFGLISLYFMIGMFRRMAPTNKSSWPVPANISLMRPSLLKDQNVLIGLLTLPEKYERRFLVRTLYGQMSSPLAKLYFVFCDPSDENMRDLIMAENALYDDILVLDCVENMDNGKTYSFFSSLPKIFKNSKFKYVMKTDDDVFLHIPNLVNKLMTLSNKGLYFGREVIGHGFMAGMGYAISWDLVEWIAQSDYARNHREGQEDATLAGWLHHSGLVKHRVSDENGFYDYPESGKGWAKPYIPGTILIHRLKDSTHFIKANMQFMRPLISKYYSKSKQERT